MNRSISVFRQSLFILKIVCLLVGQSLSAQEFAAGKETVIKWEGTAYKHIKVYLPTNYQKDKKWPVLIYFHGTYGSPDTSLLQTYTEQKDFIIIGMDYFIKGHMNFNSNEELSGYALKEFNNAAKALNTLKGKVSYDPGKIILSGVSKGGWMTSFISEFKFDVFAGAAVFVGGVLPGKKKMVSPRIAGKPVYIGDGEYDANFYPSYACIEYFNLLKAKTTFEYYDGLAHEIPPKAPARFAEWLNLFRPGFDLKIKQWYQDKIASFKKDKTLKTYREIRESPYLHLLSSEQKKAFNPVLKQKLSEDKNFEKELKAYNTFFAIIKVQSKSSFPKDWRKVIALYQKFFKGYEGTEFAQRAKHHYEVAQQNLKKSIEFYERKELEKKAVTQEQKEASGKNNSGKGMDINSGRSSIVPVRR